MAKRLTLKLSCRIDDQDDSCHRNDVSQICARGRKEYGGSVCDAAAGDDVILITEPTRSKVAILINE